MIGGGHDRVGRTDAAISSMCVGSYKRIRLFPVQSLAMSSSSSNNSNNSSSRSRARASKNLISHDNQSRSSDNLFARSLSLSLSILCSRPKPSSFKSQCVSHLLVQRPSQDTQTMAWQKLHRIHIKSGCLPLPLPPLTPRRQTSTKDCCCWILFSSSAAPEKSRVSLSLLIDWR